MTMKPIILGSRGSDLALWQARYVKSQLEALNLTVVIKIIVTQGDRIQHLSFDKLEGKGFFTKEIEDALLSAEIDLAVHSLKDLPTTSPKGLQIAALSYREDPRDVLLIRKAVHQPLATFGIAANAVVGTSSARRKAQLRTFFPDITINDLRGNVPTRVQKCRDGQYDAIVLAAAGIGRLKLDVSDFELVYFDPEIFVPAPAQGVLGLQIRENEPELEAILQKIHRADVAETVDIERNILAAFEGGCHMPLGVYCRKIGATFDVYTAKSNSADELPVYLKLTGTNVQSLIDQSFALANSQKPLSVLITKKEEELPILSRLLKYNGITTTFQSLIQTKLIPVPVWPETDWVFFGSRNAVKFALQSRPDLLKNKKIGAVGLGTAKALSALGYRSDFVGEQADITLVAGSFSNSIKPNETVLLPLGEQSARTLVKNWENKLKLKVVIVYATKAQKIEIMPKTDLILFTSPSNVISYLEQGGPVSGVTALAMGKTTLHSIESNGFTDTLMCHGYSELALATSIFGLR